MAKSESNRVRIQLYVDRALAERVGELGTLLHQSQSWMAAELVAAALQDRARINQWIASRLLEGAVYVFKPPIKLTGEYVYLQALIPAESKEELDKVADLLQHTPARMGALLLEYGIRDNQWVIEAVAATKRVAKLLQDFFDRSGAAGTVKEPRRRR